jgi:hypothetical protein
VPAVLVGSMLSSRAPDRFIRPVITVVILASGLKYVGLGTTALGLVIAVVAPLALVIVLLAERQRRRSEDPAVAGPAADALPAGQPEDEPAPIYIP